MPNFELSESHKYVFRNACKALTEVRTETMEQDFPLSQQDIEQGIIPAEMRQLFNKMRDFGVDSIHTTISPSIFVAGEGIERPVAIQVTGIQRTYYAYGWQDSYSMASEAIKKPNIASKLLFNNAVLEPERYAKLVKWVNAAVREHRQALLTCTIVNQFINSYAGTIGHVVARWPALTLVFEEMDRCGMISSRSQNSWRDRVNQLPATKDRWGWPKGDPWYEKNKKIMQVCDEMLVGAATMARPQTTPGIKARIVDWKRKEGEKI